MASRSEYHPRIFGAVLALIVLSGCHAGPDLRVAADVTSKVSFDAGERLLEEGRAVEAVTAFRRRIREKGADLKALNGLAIAYNELGRTDLAAEMFSRALAMAPDDPGTLNNIGFAALRRADERLARHYLEQAQRGEGDHAKIEGNLARLALLEKSRRSRAARPALAPAVTSTAARRPLEAIKIALPARDARTPAAMPVPEARQPTPSQSSMIDFMTVADPFSRHLQAE